MSRLAKKPVKSGNDYLRDKNWEPRMMTKAQAQKLADKWAKEAGPRWEGFVFEAEEYFRINIGAKG